MIFDHLDYPGGCLNATAEVLRSGETSLEAGCDVQQLQVFRLQAGQADRQDCVPVKRLQVQEVLQKEIQAA